VISESALYTNTYMSYPNKKVSINLAPWFCGYLILTAGDFLALGVSGGKADERRRIFFLKRPGPLI
jgi:hypothetical protein